MNQPIAINTTRKHVVWLDVVRLVAMFTIVCCHSADPFNFYPGEPPANIDEIKFWGAAYGAFLRPCVPLFVMITGAVSYTHLRAHETGRNLVCRLLLEKKKT